MSEGTVTSVYRVGVRGKDPQGILRFLALFDLFSSKFLFNHILLSFKYLIKTAFKFLGWVRISVGGEGKISEVVKIFLVVHTTCTPQKIHLWLPSDNKGYYGINIMTSLLAILLFIALSHVCDTYNQQFLQDKRTTIVQYYIKYYNTFVHL